MDMGQPYVEDEVFKGLQFNFSNFLWRSLASIHAAEDEGDYMTALMRALSLVKFLPAKIKNELRDDVLRIESELRRVSRCNIRGHHYTRMLVRNRLLQNKAYRFYDAFVSKMIELLDERGYLERIEKSRVKYGFE